MAKRTNIATGLVNNAYTQVSTTETTVIVQNTSGGSIQVIVADALADIGNDDIGHILNGMEGITFNLNGTTGVFVKILAGTPQVAVTKY